MFIERDVAIKNKAVFPIVLYYRPTVQPAITVFGPCPA